MACKRQKEVIREQGGNYIEIKAVGVDLATIWGSFGDHLGVHFGDHLGDLENLENFKN